MTRISEKRLKTQKSKKTISADALLLAFEKKLKLDSLASITHMNHMRVIDFLTLTADCLLFDKNAFTVVNATDAL